MKRKSMTELQDCLNLIHNQLQVVFYSKNPNPKHIDQLSKWYDQVAIEIDYRISITLTGDLNSNIG